MLNQFAVNPRDKRPGVPSVGALVDDDEKILLVDPENAATSIAPLRRIQRLVDKCFFMFVLSWFICL